MTVGMPSQKKLALGAHSKSARRSEMWNDGRMIGEQRSRGHLRREACTPAYWEVICRKRRRAIRKTLPKDDPVRKHHIVV